MTSSPLADELRSLASEGINISTIPTFGDLLWDENMGLPHIRSLDPAVVLDAVSSHRIVMQRVRGEIRYWCTTDRNPYSKAIKTELGIVSAVDDARSLCQEFLCQGVEIGALRSRRMVLRREDHSQH